MFKTKKVNCKRAFACLLVLFTLLTVWAAFAETVPAPEAALDAAETPAEASSEAARILK